MSGPAPLKRVKLSFKDDRLIMPVTNTTGKVATLLADATLRFRTQRLLGKDDSFIQVRTADGYVISPNDNIEEVIEQNDDLVLVNRSAWISEFKRAANPQYWFGLRQYDHTSNISRDISVSYSSSRNALCITLWNGNEEFAMEVFDRDTLSSYAKDGEILVLTNTDKKDGVTMEQSVLFTIKQSKATAVKLVLKTFSDPQAMIKEWPLEVSDSGITQGEVKDIQSNWPAPPSKVYTVPETKRTGKLLEADTIRPQRDLIAEPNISSGASPLIYTQTSNLAPEKYCDTSKTNQHLRVEFSVTNNSELDTHIARVGAEYQKADGSWAPIEFITRGYRQNDWSWDLRQGPTDPFLVPARGIEKFAIGCRLELPPIPHLSSRSRSIDMSLPVPMTLRYTFTDQDQKASTITVTIDRRGVELPTFESMLSERSGLQKYFFVDNLTSGERFGAYYVLNDTENYLRIVSDSSYYNIDATQLHTLTLQAIAANTPEVEIKSYNQASYTGSFHALVDLEQKYAYGIRVRLSTPDGTLDESFLLPKDKW